MRADRKNKGKTDLHVIDPIFIEKLARVCTMGEAKYGKSNWIKGLSFSNVLCSMKRHLASVEMGEDIDNESGMLHILHVAWGCMALTRYMSDDRYQALDLDDRRWNPKLMEGIQPELGSDWKRIWVRSPVPDEVKEKSKERAESAEGRELGMSFEFETTINEDAASGLFKKVKEMYSEPEQVTFTFHSSPGAASVGDIADIQNDIAEWADSVYPDRTVDAALRKLNHEEIPELMLGGAESADEYADVLILLFDLANMRGIDLLQAVRDKMLINKARKWNIDRSTGVMSHVKEDE